MLCSEFDIILNIVNIKEVIVGDFNSPDINWNMLPGDRGNETNGTD